MHSATAAYSIALSHIPLVLRLQPCRLKAAWRQYSQAAPLTYFLLQRASLGDKQIANTGKSKKGFNQISCVLVNAAVDRSSQAHPVLTSGIAVAGPALSVERPVLRHRRRPNHAQGRELVRLRDLQHHDGRPVAGPHRPHPGLWHSGLPHPAAGLQRHPAALLLPGTPATLLIAFSAVTSNRDTLTPCVPPAEAISWCCFELLGADCCVACRPAQSLKPRQARFQG